MFVDLNSLIKKRVKQLRIIAEPPSVLQLKMSLNEELVF